MNRKKGTFYAVSVGPGDPELLTRQACRILAQCPVLAAPQTPSGRMLALEIARGAVDLDGKQILPLQFSMSRDRTAREKTHRAAADCVERTLRAGKDVAMVNLGDVSLYATAYYVFDAVRKDGFVAVMIPGVTSLSAVAARLGWSLTEPDLPLHILPGGEALDEALALPGTKALMKSGSAIGAAAAALDRAGLLDRAAAVCNCGLPDERVCRDLRELPDEPGYFAAILVR